MIPQINANETFSVDVQTLLAEVQKEYNKFKSVANDAIKKMDDEMFIDWDIDKKWAGVMANIYTSPITVTGISNGTIHNILNRELSKSQRSEMWTRFKDVMNSALELLGKQPFSEAFRGEKIDYSNKLVQFGRLTRRFYSATLDPSETRNFGGMNGIFYRILNVVGTDIHEVSVVPDEHEVLIQPGAHFKLVRCICGMQDIKSEIASIKVKYKDFLDHLFLPDLFVVLQQIHN